MLVNITRNGHYHHREEGDVNFPNNGFFTVSG